LLTAHWVLCPKYWTLGIAHYCLRTECSALSPLGRCCFEWLPKSINLYNKSIPIQMSLIIRDLPKHIEAQIIMSLYVLNIHAAYPKRIGRIENWPICTKAKRVWSKLFRIHIQTYQRVALDVHYAFICECFQNTYSECAIIGTKVKDLYTL
jgi:hypothetical protein